LLRKQLRPAGLKFRERTTTRTFFLRKFSKKHSE
jgi:hypothetical protein